MEDGESTRGHHPVPYRLRVGRIKSDRAPAGANLARADAAGPATAAVRPPWREQPR